MGSTEGSNQEWAPMPKLPGSVMEMFNMKGRVAIITGASGGIGYEAARALAEAGCNAGSPHEME
jgi:sorbose reductase